ncbi:EpsG family protein [Maribellus maritimus]|uniref:EpsG family protein n=1 Tax=Maribellus maritimus TaxID=2870838 RepID=UPI001EEBE945|nr:EpsG family protein [Maribellus maritimus]MCG6191226.1 EpsG family protein [Maribellus maritimus]
MHKLQNKINLPVIGLFIIYPLISLPFLLIEVINKKKYAVVLLSFFMAALGYILIPTITDDLTKHYDDFSKLTTDWGSFKFLLIQNTDFVLTLFQFFIKVFNLSPQLIPFLSVFIGYFLKFLILFQFVKIYEAKNERKIPKTIWILLIAFTFLTISFRNFALNIRMPVALTLQMYGLFVLYFKKEKSGLIYMALGTLTHFMTIIFILFILILKYFNRKNLFRILFIISFGFNFIPQSIIVKPIQQINISNEQFIKKQQGYTEGFYYKNFMEEMSFKGKVSRYIGLSFTYLIFLYLLIFKRNSKLRNFVYLCAILTNFFYSMPMFFARYSYALQFFFYVLFLFESGSTFFYSKKGLLMLKLLTLYTILLFTAMVYSTRVSIIKSHSKVLYNNIITLFNIKVTKQDYIY